MKRAIASILFAALFVLLIILPSIISIDWTVFEPATCTQTVNGCFCELDASGSVRQPGNAYSSLAFVWAAFWLVGQALDDGRKSAGFFNYLYAGALIVTGLGSWFYHASLTFLGQTLDVTGMYFIGTFIVLYNLNRFKKLTTRVAITCYLLMNLPLFVSLLLAPQFRRFLFAFLIIAVILIEVMYGVRKKPVVRRAYFVSAVLSLLVGFLFWIIDNNRILCIPLFPVQGHFIWHILDAAAALFLFYYYRSEMKPDRAA